MLDFILNLQGDFDNKTTKENIEKGLKQIQKDISRELSFVGNLNIAETQKQLQSQLNQISQGLSLNINGLETINKTIGSSNIGKQLSDNLTDGLKTTQQQGTKLVTNLRNDSIKSIDEIKKAVGDLFEGGGEAGRKSPYVKSFTDGLDGVVSQIDRIRTSISDGGKVANLSIIGTDDLGRQIEVVRSLNKESGEIKQTVTNITQNLAAQRNGLKKNEAEYVKQKKLINDIAASAKELWFGQNRKNPIDNIDMGISEQNGISTLYADFDKLTPKAKEFVTNYNEWIKVIRLANQELEEEGRISSELELALNKAQKAAITASRDFASERSTPTDFRTKDVGAEIEAAYSKLRIFEGELEKVGLTLNDVKSKNGETLKDLLDTANTTQSSNAFGKYLDQLSVAKAKLKEVQTEQKNTIEQRGFGTSFTNANSDLEKLINRIRELGVDETKLTYTTQDLYNAFDKVSDTKGLQTLKSMMSQVTKEVDEQSKELVNEQRILKEWEKYTSDINKVYSKATDITGNSKAITDDANLQLLQTRYQELIELVAKFGNSTSETYESNKREVERAVQSFKSYSQELQNSGKYIKDVGAEIDKLSTMSQKGIFAKSSTNESVQTLRNDIVALEREYSELQGQFESSGATEEVTQRFEVLKTQIEQTSQRALQLRQSLTDAQAASTLAMGKKTLNNRMETWLNNNTKASEQLRSRIIALKNQIESADGAKLTELKKEFQSIRSEAEATNQTGKRLVDTFREKISKFSGWFAVSNVIMGFTNSLKQAWDVLHDVDDILTEISKTSDMTDSQLEELGKTAFDSASKYGKTVQSYLTGVQEMSRAGYGDAAEDMAKLSTLAQSAGDMTADVANDYLIATDAAYKLAGSQEELSKILDGQNQITNRYAISMTDIAEATKEAASMASNYGVSIEQLSALITMAVSRTRQSGSEAGTALNALFVNLSDVTNKERMKAFDALGVEVYKFVNGVKQVKTPIELLGELSQVMQSLPEGDERINILLNEVGGKHHANTLAAILQDWQSMEGIMNTYYNGMGSAEQEAEKSAQNLSGKINELKNSTSELVQSVVDTDDGKMVVELVNGIIEVITLLTDKLGVLGTAAAAIGGVTLFKNVGRDKLFSLIESY